MSRRVNKNIVILEVEANQQCDDCGKISELRPYGKNGAIVCHPCAMKDEPNAIVWMNHHLYGGPKP